MNFDDVDGDGGQTNTTVTATVTRTEDEGASAEKVESPAESLPVDAVERILVLLASSTGGDPVDMCNASMVARTWREAANASHVWEEMLEQRCFDDKVSQEDELFRNVQPTL